MNNTCEANENLLLYTFQRFQNLEAIYLKQMKDFLNSYAVLMENSHEMIGQVRNRNIF
jgi:hypothetical protein